MKNKIDAVDGLGGYGWLVGCRGNVILYIWGILMVNGDEVYHILYVLLLYKVYRI